MTVSTGTGEIRATIGTTSRWRGRWYVEFEVFADSMFTRFHFFGFAPYAAANTDLAVVGSSNPALFVNAVQRDSFITIFYPAWLTNANANTALNNSTGIPGFNEVWGAAIDIDSKKWWIRVVSMNSAWIPNGTSPNAIDADPTTGLRGWYNANLGNPVHVAAATSWGGRITLNTGPSGAGDPPRRFRWWDGG